MDLEVLGKETGKDKDTTHWAKSDEPMRSGMTSSQNREAIFQNTWKKGAHWPESKNQESLLAEIRNILFEIKGFELSFDITQTAAEL